MKIVCTTEELMAMTRECQTIRSNVFEDYGCAGCILFHICDDGEDHASTVASDTFEEVCDIEVVVDG